MAYTRQNAVERLLNSYERFYNITRFDGGSASAQEECKGLREAENLVPLRWNDQNVLSAVCEYYERTGQHLFMKSNELWSANQEEFIFLFNIDRLTQEIFNRCKEYAYEEGMKIAHIGSGHMYTYISPVFICGSVDPEAQKSLEKCRIYKTFRFSLHGWMEFHAACLNIRENRLHFNRSGQCMEKNLKQVLKGLMEKGE